MVFGYLRPNGKTNSGDEIKAMFKSSSLASSSEVAS